MFLEISKGCNFIKKETLAQVFSCEFCETSKNTFITEHIWTTASDYFSSIILELYYSSICTEGKFLNFTLWLAMLFKFLYTL